MPTPHRTPRHRMKFAIALVVTGVALFATVMVVLHSRRDDLLEQLRQAPAYDLAVPGADALYDNIVPSVAGAGANRTQIWGVSGSIADAQRGLDTALTHLGYKHTGAREQNLLGEYHLDGNRFRASWVGLPHRLPGGRFLGSGAYDFVVYTTIENGERADANTRPHTN